MELTPKRIKENLKQYRKGFEATATDASFDYCYNYFRSFHEEDRLEELRSPEHLQTSCLQVGFYFGQLGHVPRKRPKGGKREVLRASREGHLGEC